MLFRLLSLLVLVPGFSFSQQLIFPDIENWNKVKEGQTLSFQVKVIDPAVPKFSLEGVNGYGIHFDTLGNFSWTPSYDLADRLEKQKEIKPVEPVATNWKDRLMER